MTDEQEAELKTKLERQNEMLLRRTKFLALELLGFVQTARDARGHPRVPGPYVVTINGLEERRIDRVVVTEEELLDWALKGRLTEQDIVDRSG